MLNGLLITKCSSSFKMNGHNNWHGVLDGRKGGVGGRLLVAQVPNYGVVGANLNAPISLHVDGMWLCHFGWWTFWCSLPNWIARLFVISKVRLWEIARKSKITQCYSKQFSALAKFDMQAPLLLVTRNSWTGFNLFERLEQA